MKEGNAGHIAGKQTVGRHRVHARPSPNCKVRHHEKQSGTHQAKAGNAQRRNFATQGKAH